MQRALGWLSWPPSDVMACDVNVIRIALAGRIELLQAIFGTKESTEPKRGTLTAGEWNAFKTRHNSRYDQRRASGGSKRAVKPRGGTHE